MICKKCGHKLKTFDFSECPKCGYMNNEEVQKYRDATQSIESNQRIQELNQSKNILDGKLNNYICNAQGIGRTGLNVMCLIGVFIFGWLLTMVFDQLGKKGKGWFYLFPIILIIVISRQGANELLMMAPVIYIAGWIHANLILSEYQSLARQRIAQIDQIPNSDRTTDMFLERGILMSKVLRHRNEAFADFTIALKLLDGDPRLLNFAGVQLCATNQFKEAKQLFDRAMSTVNDEMLAKQIKQNQAFVEKKLNKETSKESIEYECSECKQNVSADITVCPNCGTKL